MSFDANEEALTFTSAQSDDQRSSPGKVLSPWKLLIVDDDEEIHVITRIVMRYFKLDGAPLLLLHAYSAEEAKHILSNDPEVAVVLLDVVMETDDAGLRLVEWIRSELGNRLLRIVLRTGQPGAAPEKKVITDYDINDYKSKNEITDIKLYTTIMVAVRGYRDLRQIVHQKEGFRHLLASTGEMFRNRDLETFFHTVLYQVLQLLRIGREYRSDELSGLILQLGSDSVFVAGAVGSYRPLRWEHLASEDLSGYPGVPEAFAAAVKARGPVFEGDFFGDFFADEHRVPTMILVHCPDGFSALDRELLLIFSANIAIAHSNLSLAAFIENSQKEIIYTLGDVVESRSRETGNHVRRVGAVAALLLSSLGKPESDQERIRLAAPMHDIGKIGIPDGILQKPGPLSDEERDIVKRHAEIGFSILKSGAKGVLRYAASIALHHHERWDGKGYPAGLAGEAIPLEGRITAIADVFDALTHDRAYKNAWTVDEAFEYIAENAGTQFDPNLVNVFLASRASIEAILEEYGEERGRPS